MKLKYLIERNNDTNELKIKEFTELDAGIFSQTCEESYAVEGVASAIGKGEENLISLLRTQNLFHPRIFAERIAQAVTVLFSADSSESVELMLDDTELIQKRVGEEEVAVEEEAVDEPKNVLEIDELLDDGISDEGAVDVSSIKVADGDGSFEGD